MKYAKMRSLLLLTVMGTLASCSGLNSECSDGIDNDGNGLMDVDHAGCDCPADMVLVAAQTSAWAVPQGIRNVMTKNIRFTA